MHRRRSARLARLGLVLAVALVVAAMLACQSDLAQTYRGSRLYVSGSEALDRGKPERAVADLEQAARLLPDASEVRNHLGLAYWRVGRTERARSAFEAAIALDCDNRAARTNLARLEAFEAGRDGHAMEVVRDGR